MKKTLFALTIAAFSVALFSCSSSSPVDVAKGFTAKIADGDLEGAKEFASKPTCAMLDMAAAFGNDKKDPDYEFNYVKDSVADDNAWVTYTDKEGRQSTVTLVKEDGDWKVQPKF